jgi:ABC-2 type transport system permease protein
MNALSTYLTDTATMLRRNLRHMRRYPMIFFVAGIPIVFLLLFVYVLGGTLGAGLGGAGLAGAVGGRADYIAYVIPGILVLAVAGGAQGTAISVAMDLTEGIVARFRTMSISRAAFLSGHVLANVLQTMLAIAITVVVALVIGFRPTTGPLEWLGAAGLLTLVAVALTWIAVALGMVTKSVDAASNLPMPLLLLPFFGSGFVPTASMPDPLRWFADNQPFTPIMETLRRLLVGGEIGSTGLIAVAWCVGITVVGYFWAKRLYDRDPAR